MIVLPTFIAPGTVLIESMYRIRRISSQILADKIHDSGVTAADLATKKDIMSIMVRARKGDEDAEASGEKGGVKENTYKLSDEALVDQVVSCHPYHPCFSGQVLKFLFRTIAHFPRGRTRDDGVRTFVGEPPPHILTLTSNQTYLTRTGKKTDALAPRPKSSRPR